MSSQRGNTKRTRASKHQNTFKYQHNKSSKRTKEILGSPIEGVCDKCFKVLEWKKDYRKYKPLTVPKKCTSCSQKRITRSYTIICEFCAKKAEVCARCREKRPAVVDFNAAKKLEEEEMERERLLAKMTERDRRTYLRKLEQGSDESSGESSSDGKGNTEDEDYEGDEGGDGESDVGESEEDEHKELAALTDEADEVLAEEIEKMKMHAEVDPALQEEHVRLMEAKYPTARMVDAIVEADGITHVDEAENKDEIAEKEDEAEDEEAEPVRSFVFKALK